jgi:hypothetical protein
MPCTIDPYAFLDSWPTAAVTSAFNYHLMP